MKKQENLNKTKKSLILLIPSLEFGGGAERIASILSKKLSSYYRIYLLTFYKQKNTYSYEGTYLSLYSKSKFWKKILIPIKLYSIIRIISPDLIISFIDYANSLIILTKILFRMKIPLFICNHTNPLSHYQQSDRYLNILIPILYSCNHVNKIITIADFIKDILNKSYGIENNKIKTIYNGLDNDQITELRVEEIKKGKYSSIFNSDKYIKFITMGRLIKIKGHKYLINAFAEVKKKIPNSRLFILGEGPLKESLIKLIHNKNLEREVFLLGLKKNPYKFLSASDIFVLPSLIEGLPMSIIEAMACELPVIATRCKSGIEEILQNEKFGILTNRKDAAALAEKMIELSQNTTLREKYSELSSQRAKFFDIKKLIQTWINTIESVLKIT
jgi:glycosyltransferase involved in cell wall biosynthesis